MGNGSILDLVMPIRDEVGVCKLPCPLRTLSGCGLVTPNNVNSGLVYTKTCTCASLVLQAAVTSAARGHKVLIIMGGDRWEKLPPSWHQMPEPDTEVMKRVSFLYPSSVQEIVKFTCEASVESLPSTVIICGIDEIIQKSTAVNSERKFAQNFARLVAILQSFSIFCAEKNNESCTRLLAVTKLNLCQERFLSSKFSLWFPEIWEAHEEKFVCKSSPRKVTVNFSLTDNEYFLESFMSN